MRPASFSFTILSSLGLLWSSVSTVGAQELPPRPPGCIRDDARAFSEPVRAQLAAEMQEAGTALRCEVWLAASTFLTSSDNLRNYSRELRRSWSGEGDAVLLAYDRASEKQFLSFSPGLWEKYPSAHLVTLMQRSVMILAEKENPLEDRLSRIMRETLSHLQTLEMQRQQMQQALPADHRQVAMFYAGGLVLAMLALLIGCGILRKREAAMEDLPLPESEV